MRQEQIYNKTKHLQQLILKKLSYSDELDDWQARSFNSVVPRSPVASGVSPSISKAPISTSFTDKNDSMQDSGKPICVYKTIGSIPSPMKDLMNRALMIDKSDVNSFHSKIPPGEEDLVSPKRSHIHSRNESADSLSDLEFASPTPNKISSPVIDASQTNADLNSYFDTDMDQPKMIISAEEEAPHNRDLHEFELNEASYADLKQQYNPISCKLKEENNTLVKDYPIVKELLISQVNYRELVLSVIAAVSNHNRQEKNFVSIGDSTFDNTEIENLISARNFPSDGPDDIDDC